MELPCTKIATTYYIIALDTADSRFGHQIILIVIEILCNVLVHFHHSQIETSTHIIPYWALYNTYHMLLYY